MTNQKMQELVVEELAGRIAEYLAGEKGAVEESALVAKFRGFGRIRTKALRWLAARGHIRRTRNACGTTVVAFASVPAVFIEATAGLHECRMELLAAERREALKPTAQEYGTDTASYLFYTEELAAGTITAEDLPFKLPAERQECPKVRRPRRWKGGDGRSRALDFSAAAQAERREREQRRDFLSPEARRSAEERLENGDAAWKTAKAHHVANLPTLSHKILHLLARDGATTEASFLPLAEAEEHPIPHKAVREAVQELGEAGKIRKVRSRKTGEVRLASLARMTEREIETLLIGVMADERSGIPVPADTMLSRRVEGFRKAKAEKKAAAREERAAEQPVEA
jgi:hypothetical protein